MPLTIIKVSQLNRYVKSILDSTEQLKEVYVKGEISNLSFASSGHLYLTLKDEAASVRAIVFSNNVAHLRFIPENGIEVIARGFATLYERDGSFSVTISDMSQVKNGDAAEAVENLKAKLESLGLFDSSRKKAIPNFPKYIGVVTSQQGAAINDIITTANSRYPAAKILLSPATVQGETAAKSIERAINTLVFDGRSNVIIVGRGGGSTEDLSAFNDEITIRAMARCPIPIISAVGHENDTTLCDLVADARGATPTAAAVMATPNRLELLSMLESYKLDLSKALLINNKNKQDKLSQIKNSSVFKEGGLIISSRQERINSINSCLNISALQLIGKKRERISVIATNLDLVSPLKVLSRGYSITLADDKAVLNCDSLTVGQEIKTKLSRGSICSVIKTIEKE